MTNKSKKAFVNALNTITNHIHKGSTIDDYPTLFVVFMAGCLIIAILLNPFIYLVKSIIPYLSSTNNIFVVLISYLIGIMIGLLIFKFNFMLFVVLYFVLLIMRLLDFKSKSV